MGALPAMAADQLRVLHVGGYWRGPNDMVRQMMLGLRATGATVEELNTDQHREALDTEGRTYDRGTWGPVWLRWDCVDRKIEEVAPHLIVCNAGGLSFRPWDAERLRGSTTLLQVVLSDPDVFESSTRQIAPHFDFVLTNAPSTVPRYRALGVKADVLPIATHDGFFHPVPPRPELACDVVILGRAHPDRIHPVKALAKRFETHVYGEGWEEHGVRSRGLAFGDDALAALASARMTVVFFRTGGNHALVKVGLMDFAAAGTLVVTNEYSEVERYFEYGREIVGFTSTEDLLEKVDYFLRNPEEAAAIREAGRARVLRDHTWRQVWPRLLQKLQGGER